MPGTTMGRCAVADLSSSRRAGSLAAVVVAVAVGAGCNDPTFRDCRIACTTESGCPRGLACGAEGYCRTPDDGASCRLVVGDARPDTLLVIDAALDAPPDAPPIQIIGNASEFSGSSNHAPNYLLGFRITVPAPRTLLRFGVFAKQATPNAKLALYAEAAGEPSTLIAATSSFALQVGPRELAVPATAILAGNYWLVAVFDGTAHIGMSATSTTIKYRTQSFTSAIPTTFATASTYTDSGTFNYWIVTQ